SGLFGGYFAVSSLYTAFCLLALRTVRANARGLAAIPPAAVQDVAKLQFMMSIMWMYFFWSQYLVIWYGNVPVETRFFVHRFLLQPWLTLAWVIFAIGWLLPFSYLVKRLTGRPPERPAPPPTTAHAAPKSPPTPQRSEAPRQSRGPPRDRARGPEMAPNPQRSEAPRQSRGAPRDRARGPEMAPKPPTLGKRRGKAVALL